MRLGTLRRISASEYGAFLATAIAVPVIHVSLRIWDFRRVQAWLERHPASPASSPAPAGSPAAHTSAPACPSSGSTRQRGAIRAAVIALGRTRRYGPYAGNCLSQSLTLWWRLRRGGIATHLRLGANLADGHFKAHAWVECNGRVLNDTQDVSSRYAPLVPRAARAQADGAAGGARS
jgi:hypothetical protein